MGFTSPPPTWTMSTNILGFFRRYPLWFGIWTIVLNFGLSGLTTVFIFGLGSPTTVLNFGFGSRTTALNFQLDRWNTLGLGLVVRLQYSTLGWVVRL